jgi:hypothetical protein
MWQANLPPRFKIYHQIYDHWNLPSSPQSSNYTSCDTLNSFAKVVSLSKQWLNYNSDNYIGLLDSTDLIASSKLRYITYNSP